MEIAVLRRQLVVLRRQVARSRYTLTDRMVLATLARLLPRGALGAVRPSHLTPADAEAVFAAGWDEHALHDAVSVCALFNCMNRIVDGLGIRADGAYLTFAGRRLAEGGYDGLRALLPAPDDPNLR